MTDKRIWIVKTCITCGKTFNARKDRHYKGQSRFCSRSCIRKDATWNKNISIGKIGKPSKLKGIPLSEETRSKISKKLKGKTPWNKGIPRTEQDKNAIRNGKKIKMFGENNPFFGKKHTLEQKMKWHTTRCKEGNVNWKGGVSFEPYCPRFNKEFKERVRRFFKNTCVLCGKTQEENKKHLHIHHVTYNKESCCDNSLPLFVALCNSCHSKTNKNRDVWSRYFTDLINTKYGGECYIKGDK